MTSLEDIKDNFDFLDDWEEKYRYLIDLGKELPPFSKSDKTEENKVTGCMSQVWITSFEKDGHLYFKADSDALIVKGLIALILSIYSGKTPKEILEINLEELFTSLGLEENLSPTRRNGFFSMRQKILETAKALLD